MEPSFRFATTTDGVRIAFCTVGEGYPLINLRPFPWSHLQCEWRVPEIARWFERLAWGRQLVLYDPRGAGLSQRKVSDISLDGLVLDLGAVVDHLGLERFALCALITSGPVAVAYAAQHPERVSHLVLGPFWARFADAWRQPAVQALSALAETDWELYTETTAHVALGWSQGEAAHRFAGFMQQCVTPEEDRAYRSAIREMDVAATLQQVRTPTLVIDRRLNWMGAEVGRDLAARLPDARLVIVDGEGPAFVGDIEMVATAIDEFVGGTGPRASLPWAGTEGGLCTILFTDIEGSTLLTEQLGDAGAREVLRTHEQIVREALRAHGGKEVKTLGDGFMASFGSAMHALDCAIAIQRAFSVHNAERPTTPIRVRVGINAGEPIAEAADLHGTAVIVAARLAAAATGGEILVANVVKELAVGKGFTFVDRGPVALRGFVEPVRVYALHWQGGA